MLFSEQQAFFACRSLALDECGKHPISPTATSRVISSSRSLTIPSRTLRLHLCVLRGKDRFNRKGRKVRKVRNPWDKRDNGTRGTAGQSMLNILSTTIKCPTKLSHFRDQWDKNGKSYAFRRDPTWPIHNSRPHRSTGFTPKGVTLTFFLGHWDMGQNWDRLGRISDWPVNRSCCSILKINTKLTYDRTRSYRT
jgi:hypothetical protein